MTNLKNVWMSARLLAAMALVCTSRDASAWCQAMGGYPSFEAKRQAEEQQRRAAAAAAAAQQPESAAQWRSEWQAAQERRSQEKAAQVQQLRADQLALSKLGYYTGPVNGQKAKAIELAVADFHRANNLGISTTLSQKSRDLMESGKAVSKAERVRVAATLKVQPQTTAKADHDAAGTAQPQMPLK